MEEQIDEISLYDYYKVIAKKKYLIIFIVLFATIVSFMVSYFSPKIYESQSIVKIPVESNSMSIVSDAGLKLIIENWKTDHLNSSKSNQIVDMEFDNIDISTGKLIVRTKGSSKLAVKVSNEILRYLQENKFVKARTNNKKAVLTKKISSIRKALKEAVNIKNSTVALLESRDIVGFNPVDLEVKINNLENRKIDLEERLKSLEGFGYVRKPHTKIEPVKNKLILSTMLGFIVSLFLSIFIVFFMDSLKKIKRD